MDRVYTIKDSVRGIIEFIRRTGSLDNRYTGKNRALEGTYAHQKLQASNERLYSDYKKEVSMSAEFKREKFTLIVEGRADGIIIEGKDVIIEEIKSTNKELYLITEDYNELHWLQAIFYGYIYCNENSREIITIRLSYYNIENDDVKSFERSYKIEKLNEIVQNIIDEYIKWAELKVNLDKLRDKTIGSCDFPFKEYRKGQRELAVAVFNTIKTEGVFFAQAPTGIGKTISALFPALKATGVGYGSRIVYLTAKTITRTVAEESINLLKQRGVNLKSVTLTSKEKICLNTKVDCNPESCKYAKDFFSKVNEVVFEILSNETDINREIVEKYAEKHTICPFELSLELTTWCHVIICDYNYAFDPNVRLKRIFEDQLSKNILLIDEAHNLVNRAREMYSSELLKSEFLLVTRITKGKSSQLYKIAKGINQEMIILRRELEELNLNLKYSNDKLVDLIKLLREFMKVCDEYLVNANGTEGYDEIKDLYFKTRHFLLISDLYDDNYTTIVERNASEVLVKLYCINPSENLKEIITKSNASILFSATLSPINYYIDILGGNEESYRLRLPSPFKSENLKVSKNRLNMRYEFREKNIEELCGVINRFIIEEKGNYMIFLPSYAYLSQVYEKYVELYSKDNIICQRDVITEEDREAFIINFQEDSSVVAFCVMGGMFSEGIDLPGKRLIGVVVVGVGFPRISVEGDIIKDFYKNKGFEYAYIYPGVNKVMQAVGRVIRREEDKGRALLIDDRYFTERYKCLLPNEWDL